jgi:hypothetical protein
LLPTPCQDSLLLPLSDTTAAPNHAPPFTFSFHHLQAQQWPSNGINSSTTVARRAAKQPTTVRMTIAAITATTQAASVVRRTKGPVPTALGRLQPSSQGPWVRAAVPADRQRRPSVNRGLDRTALRRQVSLPKPLVLLAPSPRRHRPLLSTTASSLRHALLYDATCFFHLVRRQMWRAGQAIEPRHTGLNIPGGRRARRLEPICNMHCRVGHDTSFNGVLVVSFWWQALC